MLTENYINEQTAFAMGEEFENEQQVREYFTVDNMLHMFGRISDSAALWSQDDLDAMADAVTANRWHMANS